MKHLLCLILAMSLIYIQAFPASDDIMGKWLNPDKTRKMEVYKSGNFYYGKIIWLKNDDGKVKLGAIILKDFVYTSNKWTGTIYLEAQNELLEGELEMPDINTLRITAYKGLFHKSKQWTRTNS